MEAAARELIAAGNRDGHLALYYILRWQEYPPVFEDRLVEPAPGNFAWHFPEVRGPGGCGGPNAAYRALQAAYRRCPGVGR
jgi:hypothetical protein